MYPIESIDPFRYLCGPWSPKLEPVTLTLSIFLIFKDQGWNLSILCCGVFCFNLLGSTPRILQERPKGAIGTNPNPSILWQPKEDIAYTCAHTHAHARTCTPADTCCQPRENPMLHQRKKCAIIGLSEGTHRFALFPSHTTPEVSRRCPEVPTGCQEDPHGGTACRSMFNVTP